MNRTDPQKGSVSLELMINFGPAMDDLHSRPPVGNDPDTLSGDARVTLVSPRPPAPRSQERPPPRPAQGKPRCSAGREARHASAASLSSMRAGAQTNSSGKEMLSPCRGPRQPAASRQSQTKM